MAFNANSFRANGLSLGGARSNLFDVQITFPDGIGGTSNAATEIPFLGKTTTLPSSTVGAIDVNYMGRVMKYPGDRTFEDWTVTFINDESFHTRNAMEQWQNHINTFNDEQSTMRLPGVCTKYRANVEVKVYSKCGSGEIISQYQIRKAWPSVIGQVDLSWDTTDEIQTFDVTFAYDDFITIGAGLSATASTT